MNAQFYARGDGWLHRLDPRVKFLLALAAIVLGCLWGNLVFLAALVALLVVMLLADGPCRRRMGRIVGALAIIDIIVMAAWIAIDGRGADVAWQWGWLRVTWRNLADAGVAALRIDAVVLAVVLVLLSTSTAQWTGALARFGIPLRASLAWVRFIDHVPVYRAVRRQVQQAQQARGLAVQGKGSNQRYPNPFGHIAARIGARFELRRATKRRIRFEAERREWAMQARGSRMDRQGLRRTQYLQVAMRPMDWIDLLLIIAAIAGVATMMWLGW